jgi:hypothetical protein
MMTRRTMKVRHKLLLLSGTHQLFMSATTIFLLRTSV